MTVLTETGYSWTDGKNARILHSGVWLPISKVAANRGGDAAARSVVNTLTYDRWSPFTNDLAAAGDDKNFEDWVIEGGSLGPDGQTFTEDSANSVHQARLPTTWVAENQILSVRFSAPLGDLPDAFVLQANDGTNLFRGVYEFKDDTATYSASVMQGRFTRLANGQFLMTIRFTPAAASGQTNLRFQVGGSENYTGNGERAIRIHEVIRHPAFANIALDAQRAAPVDCFAFAAHNLGRGQADISIQHDSDEDGTWTTVKAARIQSDEPVMVFFDPITSRKWRLNVAAAPLAEIGVIRFGAVLKMEQPFYAGYVPSVGAEEPILQGNISEGGDWLGRNVIRRGKTADYQWDLLTTPWVETNLYGRNGLIRAVQSDPFWIAWRPSVVGDVDFAWTPSPPSPPSKMGLKDRMDFSMSAQVLGVDYVE